MHWSVSEQMVFSTERTADEIAEFTQTSATNSTQLVTETLIRPLGVNDSKVRLTVEIHLDERHRVAAVSFQVGQERWDFDGLIQFNASRVAVTSFSILSGFSFMPSCK